jgi:hypothetical protein
MSAAKAGPLRDPTGMNPLTTDKLPRHRDLFVTHVIQFQHIPFAGNSLYI